MLQPDPTTGDSHVGAEWRGKARMFRNRVDIAARITSPRLEAITNAAATASRLGYKGMRPDRVFMEIERKWRALPTADQLAPLSVHRTTTDLEITDLRMTGSHIIHTPLWGTVDEPALCIACEGLRIRLPSPRKCEWWTKPLATLSAHALGRWFQRSGQSDDAALTRALRSVAESYPDLIQQSGNFSIPVDGGEWRGACCDLQEPGGARNLTLNVRTFI